MGLSAGQIYFLHNDIDTIRHVEESLAKLLPEARIRVAHGQMRQRDLEHVMRDFYQQRFNVLLCTTIIETGIDIPTANTIIINRADKFGLAQLHQLRGRVGRSHHQAYAYLLLPDEGNITAAAKKRLEAIQMMRSWDRASYSPCTISKSRRRRGLVSPRGRDKGGGFTYTCALDTAGAREERARKPTLPSRGGLDRDQLHVRPCCQGILQRRAQTWCCTSGSELRTVEDRAARED